MTDTRTPSVQRLDRVVVRFAGDSGDGMQLTGDRFTSAAAAFGNDLATMPNFPAEIRAPQGTIPGVSSFQVHFADYDILTAGDRPDVLVAMNPAALKANLRDLPHGATLVVNTDEFTTRNLTRAGYRANPLDDDALTAFQVHRVAMTTLTLGALAATGLGKKDTERAKNMFALGLLSWMYHRPTEGTERFLREKFARKPGIAEANVLAFRAGWNYGETTERSPRPSRSPLRRPCRRASTGRSAATPPSPTRSSPPQCAPGCRSSWAVTPSPQPATSCTSWPGTRTSTSPPCRPRTRSPPSEPLSARHTAEPWA
jgi:2-oxoglutarate/2-oxoacid ferredoxin oxidoreductase subunit alpha